MPWNISHPYSLYHSYVSTMTASQRIVRDNGVFFGPKKAQEQLEMMVQKATPIVPPLDFGTTVERLLEKNIIFDFLNGNNLNGIESSSRVTFERLQEAGFWTAPGLQIFLLKLPTQRYTSGKSNSLC